MDPRERAGCFLLRNKDHVLRLFPDERSDTPEYAPLPPGYKMSEERRRSVEHPMNKAMKGANKKGPIANEGDF